MEKKNLQYDEVKETIEARRIFRDFANYSDKQLLGYYRLFKAIIEKHGFFDGKIRRKETCYIVNKSELISELEANIQKLDNNLFDVIQLHFFESYSLREISEKLFCSISTVYSRKGRALHNMYLFRLNARYVKNKLIIQNEKIKKKNMFLEEIKSGIKPNFDIELEYFEFYPNLEKRIRNVLNYNQILTICQFLSLKKERIEKFRNAGSKTTKSILDIQQKILNGELK